MTRMDAASPRQMLLAAISGHCPSSSPYANHSATVFCGAEEPDDQQRGPPASGRRTPHIEKRQKRDNAALAGLKQRVEES
jgi:hypothetical protein